MLQHGVHFKNILLSRRIILGSRWLCGGQQIIQRKIEMPKFMDADKGIVEKWLKKEGDVFNAGEVLCEVTINGVTLGIDQKDAGVLAEILVSDNTEVSVGKDIGIIVDGTVSYEAFLAKYKQLDEQKTSTKIVAPNSVKVNMTLIKIVKNLIKTNVINAEESFAHDLLSLCRLGNSELNDLFEASYDGEEFNDETFEIDFFVQSAKSIVIKYNVSEKKNN